MSHQQQPMQPQNIQHQHHEQPENEEVSDHNSEFSEDFNENEEDVVIQNADVEQIQQQLKQTTDIPKVTNPKSAYGVFNKDWRQKHPEQKIGITAMADIWKQMTKQQKQPYEKKFREQKAKYQQYEAMMLSIDPNYKKKQKDGSNKDYFFPLHRVKAIMKLDNSYAISTQNVCAMTKAVEYFGIYLLEEVKKASEGKKRIDLNSLFEAVNNCQNNLWFLNCLIDQHNLQQNNSTKGNTQSAIKPKQNNNIEQDGQHEKQKTKKPEKNASKSKKNVQIPKGQLKLTDMF